MHGETVKFTNAQQAKPYNKKRIVFNKSVLSEFGIT